VKRALAIFAALLVAVAAASPDSAAPVPFGASPRARPPAPLLAPDATSPASRPATSDERRLAVAVPGVEPHASSPREMVFALTGGVLAELAGTAYVRRQDGTAAEHAFSDGRLVVTDPHTLCGVSLRVPGYAIAWPRLDRGTPQVTVPMQRSGTIRVRLVDAAAAPLAHRLVRSICQSVAAFVDGTACQANLHATTDAYGVARIEHVVPGRHRVAAARVAEWPMALAKDVLVEAGAVAMCELVASPPPSDRYGGFCFPLAAGPRFRVADHGVFDHVFATPDGSAYELAVIDDEVRCIAMGRQGELVTGSIVPVVTDGNGSRFGLPLCAPLTITIGAVVPIAPEWLRAH
jgi:hypothetical protein